MDPIEVRSADRHYEIHIGEDIRFHLDQYIDKQYSSIMIITDDHVADLYLQDVMDGLSHSQVYKTITPSGEQAKQLNTFYELQTKAIENSLDRQSLIIALGGGVVGDIAGFVAATFMRGIDYMQVPTTILAHDSSVGGKVAINHEHGKNLIGSFHPPVAVIYDVNTLQSLNLREVRSGYAEIIKEAMIANESFFVKLLEMKIASLTKNELSEHLFSAIQIKKQIVMKDERESGERMYLNLGHTFGHALESMHQYQMFLHGEAVAIGLLFAVFVSEQYFNVELSYNSLFNWLHQNEYPLQIQNLDRELLLTHMRSDKKIVNQQQNIILLKSIAEPVIVSIPNDELEQYVHKFLDHLNDM